eukprot:jgi/Botrbrau1/7046/Bobra.0165s0069.1
MGLASRGLDAHLVIMSGTVGLLIRGGDILEAASRIDTLLFDKTGTLTTGKATVVGVVPWVPPVPVPGGPPASSNGSAASSNGAFQALGSSSTASGSSRVQGPQGTAGTLPGTTETPASILAIAAALERHTDHPIARAITSAAPSYGADRVDAEEGSISYEAGSGVSGRVQGDAVFLGNWEWVSRSLPASALPPREPPGSGRIRVWLAKKGALVGSIEIDDPLRPDAAATVSALRSSGLRTYLLSGDSEEPAQAVAEAVGISGSDVFWGVKPAGKKEVVERLQREGHRVVMVGDGFNDTAALAQANVGMAMGSGLTPASEVADVVLLGERVGQVAEALQLSRATLGKIRQNLAWAFAYNAIALPLAAGALLPSAGLALTPALSGALMGMSSLTVMANSLLLQLQKFPRNTSGPSEDLIPGPQRLPTAPTPLPSSQRQPSEQVA